jgi:hypothetical protein
MWVSYGESASSGSVRFTVDIHLDINFNFGSLLLSAPRRPHPRRRQPLFTLGFLLNAMVFVIGGRVYVSTVFLLPTIPLFFAASIESAYAPQQPGLPKDGRWLHALE